MYWPLGAPRVYAVKGLPTSSLDETQEEGAHEEKTEDSAILGLRVPRSGQLFATITATSLNIWQTSPVVLLASVIRSVSSRSTYGSNVDVLLRPDSSIVAVQTSHSYLVTYKLSVDSTARVYQQQRQDEKATRRRSSGRTPTQGPFGGQRDVRIHFRMIIKIESGICKALALDEELVVATEKPAAIQCIRWVSDGKKSQTSFELLNRVAWINKKTNVVDCIYDRAMSLFIWIANDGMAYAVQRITGGLQKPDASSKLFRGYGFHIPSDQNTSATKAAINARFSLLAIGCSNGEVHVYTARDYSGSAPFSHKLVPPASQSTTGAITFLSYSPDGYCLFVGYERGWVMWSVYGKMGGNSFVGDRTISAENEDLWLSGTYNGSWIDGGSAMIFSHPNDARLWVLELVRSAVTGCFGPANVSRMLLLSSSAVMLYRGHDLLDLLSVSSDPSLWHRTQIPQAYLIDQRPIRSAVVSPDGRYIAVAGRRGLAHYSMSSGRWKTFDDPEIENSFVVRGGMCWFQHILIAAVEFGEHHELRLFSREHGLNESSLIFVERFTSPIAVMTPTGENSLLIYTFDNNLYHYIISSSKPSVQLVQVGQIGLHGIVRAPTRVRAVTWYIPEYQLLDGDPSQDVVHASVIFLVDAKLVLLQPTKDNEGALKYDMRIIASNVEYYAFIRDQGICRNTAETPHPMSALEETGTDDIRTEGAIHDSLWFFNGSGIQCWTDTQELLKSASLESQKETAQPISIPVDFYPTAIALRSGVVIGLEPELVQRRDTQFAFFRSSIRTQLFLPSILRHYLAIQDFLSALNLAYHYQHLSYFPHALEVLLHTVLDEEVDSPSTSEHALLPSVVSFLSSFPDYLDIVVQCTRKTEVRSWRTLFKYLPPPLELFEESMHKGLLKTAGGYLLILHTFEELDSSSEQCIRLLQQAKEVGDWDLCKELARFLVALDESGDSLDQAMERLDLSSSRLNGHSPGETTHLQMPLRDGKRSQQQQHVTLLETELAGRINSGSRSAESNGTSHGSAEDSLDYFPTQPH